MYLKARRGKLKNFTGIDDPYEPPVQPEIELETTDNTAEENARLIAHLTDPRLSQIGFDSADCELFTLPLRRARMRAA